MTEKTRVRKGRIGDKEGWCFSVGQNFVSALFKTRKEAKAELERYLKTGDFVIYGSAE